MLNTKFTFVSYPPILNISFGLSIHGLSYSLQSNWRSNSKFTHQLIMNSPDLSPVLLHYSSDINGLWKVFIFQKILSDLISSIFQKSIKLFESNPWDLNKSFVNTASHESKILIVCKFSTWPPTAFEAVAEAIHAWSLWKFQEVWVRY